MANICRLCLSTVLPSSIIPVYKDRPPPKEQIMYLLPDIDIDLTSTLNLCYQCVNLLHTTYSFVLTCRETEKTIKKYISQYTSTSVNLDEIQEFQNGHFSLIDSTEIKIETHDVEIKTEIPNIDVVDKQVVEEHETGCFHSDIMDIKEYDTGYPSHSIRMAGLLNTDLHEVEKSEIGNSTMIHDVPEDVLAIRPQNLEINTKIENVDETNLRHKQFKDEAMEKANGNSALISQTLEDVNVESFNTELNTEPDIDVKEQSNITHVCNECNKTFEDKETQDVHQKQCVFHKIVGKTEFDPHRKYHSIPETRTSLVRNKIFQKGSEADVCHLKSPIDESTICDICQSVFSSQMELQNHTLTHKTSVEKYSNPSNHIQFEREIDGPYKCQTCSETFIWKSHLTRHIQCKHKTDRPYKCQTCGITFKLKAHLTRHIQCKHERDRLYKCQICDKNFTRNSHLARHMQCKHEIDHPYKCQTCGMGFKLENRLTTHIQFKHEMDGTYKCQTCNTSFTRNSHLKRHIQSKHETARPYKCQTCGITFKLKAHLTRHIQCKHERDQLYKCQICDKNFTRNSHLARHIQCKHEIDHPYKCQTCGMGFKLENRLTTHIQLKHEMDGAYKCQTCNTSFTRNSHLKRHIQSKHETARPYKCQTCGMSYKLKSHLTSHIQCKHEVDRSYKCQTCDMSFTRKSHLTRHKKSNHAIDQHHKCQICGVSFKWRSTLRTHIQSKHEIDRPHKCKFCDKSFSVPFALKVHIETHIEPNEKRFQCSYKRCEKRFRFEKVLAKHLRRHKKSHKCETCDRMFAGRGALRRHMMLHTGERPFRCNLCDKAYIQKGNLEMHLQSCRGKDQSLEVVKVEESKIVKEELPLSPS